MSKIWRVDLSDVTASSWLEGENARENMIAGSTPRRNSMIRAQLFVEKTRIKVPWYMLISFNDDNKIVQTYRCACRRYKIAVWTDLHCSQT